MAVLDECKTALRISLGNTVFDGEINGLINACRQDLILAGIASNKANDSTDALINRAIIVYCKANFGFDNPDSDRLQQSYNSLKTSLALSTDYTGGDTSAVS